MLPYASSGEARRLFSMATQLFFLSYKVINYKK